MTSPQRGMILLNKSAGLTSFQSLGVCKRSFATKKVGHAGTLDKFAEGLLLVFINEATRLVPFFVGLDKTYEADILFGQETDTLDPSGEIVRTAAIPEIDQIVRILPQFMGHIEQIPPAYSAIHIDGKRAYERVLAGEALDLKARPVEISELEVISWSSPVLRIRVSCSSGTYIRSLARDLAVAAGSAGSLSALSRTRIGNFHLSDAVVPPREAFDSDWSSPAFFGGARLAQKMTGMAMLDIHPEAIRDFRSGKKLSSAWFEATENLLGSNQSEKFFSVCHQDDFYGIVSFLNGELSYRLVFPPDPEHSLPS